MTQEKINSFASGSGGSCGVKAAETGFCLHAVGYIRSVCSISVVELDQRSYIMELVDGSILWRTMII